MTAEVQCMQKSSAHDSIHEALMTWLFRMIQCLISNDKLRSDFHCTAFVDTLADSLLANIIYNIMIASQDLDMLESLF